MAWSYPFPFDPQGDFLCMSNISLVSKEGGSGDPSIFYSNRVLSLFVLAMTVTLRCFFFFFLSCPTLCDLMDCNLTDSFFYGIFQARILEWVAISFSRGSS